MRFSRYILTFLFFAGAALAHAQQTHGDTLTLQQCLDIAVKNNLQVKQSDLTAQSAHIDVLQAKENLLPSINGSIGRTLSQGHYLNTVTGGYANQSQTQDSYSLTGGMTLFNGLALQNAIKSASLAYQAGKMDFQAAKDVVTVNIITGYLAILDNEEVLATTKSQFAVQKETVDRLEILEKQGANKAASDIYDQRGQLASNQVALVNAQNSLDAAKLSLFQTMNIPYKQGSEFQPLNAEDLSGNYGLSADQIYQTALQQFATVKAATLRRESSEKNVKSVKGYLWPQLTLNSGISTTYSSTAQRAIPGDTTGATQNISYGDQFKNNYGTYIGLGLNIPIFTNRYRYNNVSKAKLTLLANQNVEDNVKIVLKQNIEQAYYNMTAAYKKYQAISEQVKIYTESFRIYKLRFDSGVITSVDFIIAKNNLDAANLNLISARYDYFIDSKILDYYQGKLSF